MPDAGILPSRLAPAKVNLCLHVGAVDGRGYHPLQSLVAFADIGDCVSLTATPGLTIDGPFAVGLSAGEDNLIMKAVRRFEAHTGARVSHGIHLDKHLPMASGLGGGSADAGVVLHLLRATYAPDLDNLALESIAAGTGADGIMCLWSRPALAEGYGERLSAVALPELPCVLVNPLINCSTALIYKQFDALGAPMGDDIKHMFNAQMDVDDLITKLSCARNDLQTAAIGLNPVIADVLAILVEQPETLMARMSGSGATCFALCRSQEDAIALSRRIQISRPGDWIRVCTLG